MINNDKIPELTDNEFNDFVKQGVVFINFFKEWNMSCLTMSPILEEISDKFKKIKFGKIDIGENRNIARKLGIFSIPAFFVFKNGEIIEKFVGIVSGEEVEEKLKNLE